MTFLKLSALFFDFDGVLVDSAYIKKAAFKELFRSYGKTVVSQVIDYHCLHGGISRVDKISYVHEFILGKPLTAAELQHWAQNYSQLVVEKVVAAEWIGGAEEFLEEMNNQLPIFVISGTPENELREVVRRREMEGYFREILGSPIRKPTHINNLLTAYNLTPENCVFVGDALTDYYAAQETGMSFVGIQGDIEFPEATIVLPDCRELKKKILELGFSCRF
ncbi:MAG: HAD-IA family hydrolase [Deltaproteobacteria bacterium]|nr:HAD-IA family hydrolase [Deltaproteobacteria bacterium]